MWIFDINDHYWQVQDHNPSTERYSSKVGDWVETTDGDYGAWLTAGGQVTTVNTAAEVWKVLDNAALASPLGSVLQIDDLVQTPEYQLINPMSLLTVMTAGNSLSWIRLPNVRMPNSIGTGRIIRIENSPDSDFSFGIRDYSGNTLYPSPSLQRGLSVELRLLDNSTPAGLWALSPIQFAGTTLNNPVNDDVIWEGPGDITIASNIADTVLTGISAPDARLAATQLFNLGVGATSIPDKDIRSADGNRFNSFGDRELEPGASARMLYYAPYWRLMLPWRSRIDFVGSTGDINAPGALTSGAEIGRIGWKGFDGAAYSATPRASVRAVAKQDWTPIHNGTRLSFRVTPNDSVTEAEAASLDNLGFTLPADATAAMHAVTKQQLDALVNANDVMVIKGVINCSTNPNYPAADAGHVYVVSVAGKIGGPSGVKVEVGDRALCLVDGSASGTQSAVGANWNITQANIDGAVIGPATAVTDGAPVLWDGPTGRLTKNSTAANVRAFTGVREPLAADRTYYVRVDGSDSNNGLANTSGGAFITIQKAVDILKTLDLAGYNITIQVAAGTYTGQVALSGIAVGQTSRSGIRFTGDTTTPTNVVWQVTGSGQIALAITDGAQCSIGGFKMIANGGGTSYAIQAARHSKIKIDGKMEYGAASTAQLAVDAFSSMEITADYTISGGATRHHWITNGGHLLIVGRAITASGSPAFSSAFVDGNSLGNIATAANTYTGTITGKRYSAALNSVINTNGGGINYFPGDVAGTTATGGQYA